MARDNTKAILRLHTDIARVMADRRFDENYRNGPAARLFVVAYNWARFETSDHEEQWQRLKVIAGLTDSAVRNLYRNDAPRFEDVTNPYPVCVRPMFRGPRTGEPCGKQGTHVSRVTDVNTGAWELVGFCSRHITDWHEVQAEERARRQKPIPEPVPNTGGLLPCYIKASNWPDLYSAASYGGWKPPALGIFADDWPELAKVKLRPRFRLVQGDADDEALAATDTTDALPALRLVRD